MPPASESSPATTRRDRFGPRKSGLAETNQDSESKRAKTGFRCSETGRYKVGFGL